ncbi:cyclase family protein [Serratia marcescens]|uniref:cyclase family protein n=1 Tax=Serratia marcescens TaxID=615 RepID=UPI0021BD70DC|nr:cyclase family protein [Serratia marcescens]
MAEWRIPVIPLDKGNNMYGKIIDLSVPLMSGIASDPERFLPEIEYVDNKRGALQLAESFPGLDPLALPRQEGWAVEFVRMSTHAGTHMDAPYHYHSHMDDGSASKTIDEIPLEWCIGPGVKLDFRHFPDGYVVTARDIERELARIDHPLAVGDIVLVNTAAGGRYGSEDFIHRGCGMGREATLYLTERGVRVVGTDSWSWPRVSFPHRIEMPIIRQLIVIIGRRSHERTGRRHETVRIDRGNPNIDLVQK